MRNLLAIWLLGLHLFGNTELNQLFKLPELLVHYNKTCQQDPTVNFFDFVAMHYCGDDGDPTDNKEDTGLPFMNFNHNLSVAVVPEFLNSLPLLNQPYSAKELIKYSCNSESEGFTHSLLRPPCFS